MKMLLNFEDEDLIKHFAVSYSTWVLEYLKYIQEKQGYLNIEKLRDSSHFDYVERETSSGWFLYKEWLNRCLNGYNLNKRNL